MKRIIVLSSLIFFVLSLGAQTNFHDFTVKDIMGKDYPLSQLEGKKVTVAEVEDGNVKWYGLHELLNELRKEG